MPAIPNKSRLKAAILEFLAEEKIDSTVADLLIGLADTDIKLDLRIQPMERRADLTIRAGVADVRVPDRFMSVVRFRLDGTPQIPLAWKDPASLDGDLVALTSPGRPQFYTIEGIEDALPVFVLSPAPDADYTGKLLYNADPELLGDNDTNAILLRWPSVYLYAALSHAEGYLRNSDAVAAWQTKYDTLVAKLQARDNADQIGGEMAQPESIYRTSGGLRGLGVV